MLPAHFTLCIGHWSLTGNRETISFHDKPTSVSQGRYCIQERGVASRDQDGKRQRGPQRRVLRPGLAWAPHLLDSLLLSGASIRETCPKMGCLKPSAL